MSTEEEDKREYAARVAFEEEKRRQAALEFQQIFSSHATKAKVKKKFAKDTQTWKMFEKWFFFEESLYPQTLKGFTKGQAVNLTQGLNRCNIQHAEEQGMPDDVITLSAKAKPGEGNTWHVEISRNYKRLGEASPSKQGGAGHSWMGKYLEQETPQSQIPVLLDEAAWRVQQEAKQAARERERWAAAYGVTEIVTTSGDQDGTLAVLEELRQQPITNKQEDLLASLYGITDVAPEGEKS